MRRACAPMLLLLLLLLLGLSPTGRARADEAGDLAEAARLEAAGRDQPAAAGSDETFAVARLDAETSYWIALRSTDDAGNVSALSNVVQGTTTAGPWAIFDEPIDTVGGFYKGVDFSSGGEFQVGCAYSVDDTVVVQLYDGSTWTREVVDAATNSGAGIDFAFSPDGIPSVTYGWGSILFAWREPGTGTWTVEKIEKGKANNDYTALAYHGAEPTVAYRKGGKLQFARKVGGVQGTWSVETVESAGARYQDLTYVGDTPVIAYSDDVDGDGWLSELKVATKNGSGWTIETLASGEVGFGVYASIDADGSGNLVVAQAANGILHVFRKSAGGAWPSAPEDLGSGGGCRVMFDGSGVPHLAYVSGAQTFAQRWDDTDQAWVTERIANTASARVAIARDDQGHLGVLFGVRAGGVNLGTK